MPHAGHVTVLVNVGEQEGDGVEGDEAAESTNGDGVSGRLSAILVYNHGPTDLFTKGFAPLVLANVIVKEEHRDVTRQAEQIQKQGKILKLRLRKKTIRELPDNK